MNFEHRRDELHQELPGLGRALLRDLGISDAVIDRHKIGWDGACFTIPLLNLRGRVAAFERWRPEQPGVPHEPVGLHVLVNYDLVQNDTEQVIFVEGLLEALVAESFGLLALAVSDTGRAFNRREWAPVLARIPEILVATPVGDRRERTKYSPSRHDVRMMIKRCLPQSEFLEWPENYKRDDGVGRFFVEEKRSAEELLTLPRQ